LMSREVTSQQLLRYAAQSEIRVRSGAKLVAGLSVLAAVGAVLGVWWLAKVCGAAAVLFVLITLLEYWNAHRKRQRAASLEARNDAPAA